MFFANFAFACIRLPDFVYIFFGGGSFYFVIIFILFVLFIKRFEKRKKKKNDFYNLCCSYLFWDSIFAPLLGAIVSISAAIVLFLWQGFSMQLPYRLLCSSLRCPHQFLILSLPSVPPNRDFQQPCPVFERNKINKIAEPLARASEIFQSNTQHGILKGKIIKK